MDKRLSAITYGAQVSCPVLSVHGANDQLVPHEQSVRLHKLLTDTQVPNELMSIPGGGHGALIARSTEERTKIYATMRDFLVRHAVLNAPKATSASTQGQR